MNDEDFLEIDYCTFCGKPEWDWESCEYCNKNKEQNISDINKEKIIYEN